MAERTIATVLKIEIPSPPDELRCRRVPEFQASRLIAVRRLPARGDRFHLVRDQSVTTQRSPTEHQTAPTVNVFGGPNSPGKFRNAGKLNSLRSRERAVYLQPFAGYRGEWAFAQAILETGHFTNSDTGINNYAGIAHCDNARSGFRFTSPVIGVRAQIQLLKKYALGNQAPLAQPDIAPRAGARSNTWGALTRTWTTAPTYSTSLNSVYQAMLRHRDTPNRTVGSPAPIGVTAACMPRTW